MEWLKEYHHLSERRAARLLSRHHSTLRWKSKKEEQEALRWRLQELAAIRVRYGYRRLTVLRKREGWQVNAKRVYRLYKEEGLIVCTKQRKKLAHHARVSVADVPSSCTMGALSHLSMYNSTHLHVTCFRTGRSKRSWSMIGPGTIKQLTTLFQNPNSEAANKATEKAEKIEVTDPTHPLFGRCFRLRSVSTSPPRAGQVWVVYRDDILLRLPLTATNLAPLPLVLRPVKLTAAAVQELVALLQPTPAPCPAHPANSGADSRPRSSTKSPRS